MLRDCRINTIFEGSSEIMRLFIAREMLDPHLQVAAAALNSQLPRPQRLPAVFKAGLFYARWYPLQWLPFAGAIGIRDIESQSARRHLRYVARTGRRLARAVFHAMLRHGPKLEREQLLLGRLVDTGADLFAITAVCLRAERQLKSGDEAGDNNNLPGLMDYFCETARRRIEQHFRDLNHNADREACRLAQRLLADKIAILEGGVVRTGRSAGHLRGRQD